MTLKEALLSISDSKQISSVHRHFKTQSETERAVSKLGRILENEMALAEPIRDFQIRIAHEFSKSGLTGLGRKDLKRIPYGLWGGEHPLSALEPVVDTYLHALRALGTASWFRILTRVYFQNTHQRDATIEKVRQALLKQAGQPAWTWSGPARQFDLFSQADPSDKILKLFKPSIPAIEALGELGFKHGLETSQFASDIFSLTLKHFKTEKARHEDWMWEFGQSENELRFPECTSIFVSALLNPWLTKTPDETRRQRLIDRLIGLLGDPRIKPGAWAGVDQDCLNLIKRWLIRDSIELFLDIVDESAVDHQWHYRRAFWTSYLEDDYISEAWVAFGPTPENLARSRFKEAFDTHQKYGQLTHLSDRSHSVLILRIGDLTVAEFSHNGKCWIWPSAHRDRAPKPYLPRYSRNELMDAPRAFIHHSASSFKWQNEVANEIYRDARVITKRADWQPKG